MTRVPDSDSAQFFVEVDTACKKAVWCAIATIDGDQPRVRVVHPTWEEAIDYNLTQFGSTGPEDSNFLPVKITPTRVELSEMFGSMNKKVWRG